MSKRNSALLEQLSALDNRVVSVDMEVGSPTSADDEAIDINTAALLAAISAAALEAGFTSQALDLSLPLTARKEQVDGAATRAAEAIFDGAPIDLTVKAGEGERDSSPGAATGQHLGAETTTATKPQAVDGVFDYVDGTGLAAERAAGALALGSMGHGVRPVPDLQSYAVTAPTDVVNRLEIMSPPELHALVALSEIAQALGRPVSDLTIFTHAIHSNSMHQTLIDRLRPSVKKLIVPESVTVEPPYLLSLAGITEPLVDSMIGAVGLTELAFAATLLDLICPDYGFAFRIGSVAGPRKNRKVDTLDPLFDFSEDESAMLKSAGLSAERQYTNLDLVPHGGSLSAAIFAVTKDPLMGLSAPHGDSAGYFTNGFLITRGSNISKVTLRYREGF